MNAPRAPSTCPECGDDLRPTARRCMCGWTVPRADGAASAATSVVDLEYGWCAWRSGGERCRYPGVASSGTHGGGPWYCVGHHRLTDPMMGGHVVDESIRACGSRPDYSLASRVAGLHHAHEAKMAALGYGPKLGTAGTQRQDIDRTVQGMVREA